MARLNEVPAPTDPVELVRRKYLRQNKDIARVNSSQAVRIRNLELEISRLLTENLELRSQIIRQDCEPTRSREFVDHVGDIRSQLDEKLREITNLVQTLDKPTRPRRTSLNHDPRAKPRTNEERQQLMEALQQQEGRLPGIPEDKPLRFARQTMNEEEIASLSRSSDVYSDSPDIGPPPISHLINDTPIQAGFTLPHMDDSDNEEHATFEPVVSANLEQRRKRKDTGGSYDMRRGSGFSPLEGVNAVKSEAPLLAKPGKRKFTVCDEPEELREGRREARTVALIPVDDFKFTRKVSEEKEHPIPAPGPENEIVPTKKEVATARKPKTTVLDAESMSAPPPLTGRRALAPKMSNLDVVNSPKKRTARVLSIDEEKNRITKTKTPRDRSSIARSRSRSVDPEALEPVATTVELVLEPETPAPADIFSAPSTAPSTRPVSRDTPPPGDITGENGEAARPSRRARASVSYAEPNLRDKMRRPTKELADAITKSAKQSSEPPATIKVKSEPEEGDAWKSKLPAQAELYSTSPLSTKAAVLDPAPVQDISQRRGRRVSHQDLDLSTDASGKSGSSLAITELMASGTRGKMETDRDAIRKSLEHTRKPSAEKDVYDFDETVELGQRPRKIRPIETATEGGDSLVVAKAGSSSRRRQSALSSSSGSSSLGEKERMLKREGHVQRSSSTNLGPIPKVGGGEGEERTERLGSRRRSMML